MARRSVESRAVRGGGQQQRHVGAVVIGHINVVILDARAGGIIRAKPAHYEVRRGFRGGQRRHVAGRRDAIHAVGRDVRVNRIVRVEHDARLVGNHRPRGQPRRRFDRVSNMPFPDRRRGIRRQHALVDARHQFARGQINGVHRAENSVAEHIDAHGDINNHVGRIRGRGRNACREETAVRRHRDHRVSYRDLRDPEGEDIQIRIQLVGDDDLASVGHGVGFVRAINRVKPRLLHANEGLGAVAQRTRDLVGIPRGGFAFLAVG